MRKMIEIDEKLWREFVAYAVMKFGHRGAIKKAIREAIELWIEKEKSSRR